MTRVVHLRHLPFGRAAVLDLDRPLVIHAHSRQHVLLHLGGAPTGFGVNRRVLPLLHDSAVFVDSWQPHWYPHAAAGAPSRVLALYLERDWIELHRPSLGFAPGTNALRVGESALWWARLFVNELRENDEGRAGVLECALSELLAALKPASAGSDRSAALAAPSPESSALDRRIRKTLLFMRQHVGERPDFAHIASDAGLSRPHFFELFQRDLGLTPNVYWNALRMESAIVQLADRSLSVAAVSANLGFSAQSNFTRFFRDIQGVAPAEYRAARIQTHS